MRQMDALTFLETKDHTQRGTWVQVSLLGAMVLSALLVLFATLWHGPSAIAWILGLATELLLVGVWYLARGAAESGPEAQTDVPGEPFEEAAIGFFRTTPEGRILAANRSLVEILGYESFEALALRNLEEEGYAPGYTRAQFKECLDREGHIRGLESGWLRPDGRVVYIRESACAVRDRDGTVLYYEGTVEDVTERKVAEELLRQEEQRYRALFEHTTDAVFILDLDGLILAANPRADRLLGCHVQDLIGQPFRQWVVLREQQAHVNQVAALREGRGLPHRETVLQRADGSEVEVEIHAMLVSDPAGQPLHLQGIVRDISERKRAEAQREALLLDLMNRSTQLLTAVEIANSASTILDPDVLMAETVELIRSRFGFYYVGLFTVDEAGEYAMLRAGTGDAGREMLARGHKLAVGGVSMIGRCVADGEPRVASDVGDEAIRFDNPLLPETRSEVALPLIGRGECIGGLSVQSTRAEAFAASEVATLQAMADQIANAIMNARLYDQVQRYATRLEDLVAEQTSELRAVNKELEAFAYSVSHDLRAPLRSIDGFGQALLEDYGSVLDDVGAEYLRRMRTSSQRMGRLIDDLLHLSRLTRREPVREDVDLSDLAREISTELQRSAPDRQVEWVLGADLVAYADPGLLRAVLENLLGNAWKFTAKHETARIEFGMEERQGVSAFFVRDDGAGFDMAYRSKLFGAFQRLHGVREFEGVGVGLATVQRIIHRHGGQIWAESAVEQGATFFFTLGPDRRRGSE
ncbi:MAG: PAS domain S-box protein [Anaerolineae bacterium]|nr:PAS domain S-box protein [Anaerolineae bacterium]